MLWWRVVYTVILTCGLFIFYAKHSTASKKEKKKGKATSGAAGLLDDEASVGDKDGEEDEKSEAAGATQEEHPPEEEEDGESAMDMDGDSVSNAGRMVEAPDMQVRTPCWDERDGVGLACD